MNIYNEYIYKLIDKETNYTSLEVKDVDVPYNAFEKYFFKKGKYKLIFNNFGDLSLIIKNTKKTNEQDVFDIDIHPSGSFVALSSRFLLQFHDMKNGEELGFICMPFLVNQIRFTEDGRYLVCCGPGLISFSYYFIIFDLHKI